MLLKPCEQSTELNPEAVAIDGVFLENEIDGFRTLAVSGRELLNMEFSQEQIGHDYVLYDHWQTTRSITVKYLLQASSSQELVQKFNKLNAKLNFTEARVQFNDEPDKYYIGSMSQSANPPAGVLKFIGTYSIEFSDPHKYSVVDKVFTGAIDPDDGVLKVTINNEGTVPAEISYEVIHGGENGYLGFVSEQGAAQIGNPNETDNQQVPRSEWLFKATGTNGELNTAFANNQGFTTEDAIVKNGTWALRNQLGRDYLVPTSKGTGAAYHVASKYRKFPADSTGHVGAKSFTSDFRVLFENNKVSQTGIMGITYANADGTKRISMLIHKSATNSNNFRVKLYYTGSANQREDASFLFPMHVNQNRVTTFKTGYMQVKKIMEKISFSFGGKTYTYESPSLKDIEFDSVTFYSGSYGTQEAVWRMDWDYVFLQVHNVLVETSNDIPNTFAAGSVVTIDKGLRYFYSPTQQENDNPLAIADSKGSNWFKAPVGESVVEVFYSPFVTDPPTVKATITEEYL